MQPFEISDEGAAYVAALSTPERLVLAQVTGDVVELLGGEDTDAEIVEADLDDGETVERGTVPGVDSPATSPGSGGDEPGTPTDDLAPEVSSTPEDQLRQLLDGIDADVVVAPADPAVRRLLPDASDDPEVALEFRRLTDDDLRQRKVDRLLRFADLLLEASPSADEDEQLPMVVGRDEGAEIAGALGDVRQVIGSRLGLQSDADTDALYRSVSATWGEEDEGGEEDDEDALDAGSPPRVARGHAGEALSGPELFLGSVFLLTGYLQESLTDCLLEHHRRGGRAS